MRGIIGIRKENIDPTEKRAPLAPEQVRKIIQTNDLQVIVEPSENRIFPDIAYHEAGATISDDLSPCNIVFGVKEIPNEDLLPGKAYCFFSHTIKGQPYNMPMLKRILDLRNTLIDYECIKDEEGRRLVFFGRFAGYAGMIDAFWATGIRLASKGISNPFSLIKQAIHYDNLEKVREELRQLAHVIKSEGLPDPMVPFICGFTGYGHVSQGAQEIFDLLPFEEIKASSLREFVETGDFSRHKLYKVVFSEQDMFQPIEEGDSFDLQEYYEFPEKYQSIFEHYIPYLALLVNGIFWAPQYPRILTRDFLKKYFELNKEMGLWVIADITCDIDGSIECTVKATNSEKPLFVYHPLTGAVQDGHEGEGIVVLAVDKLPSELPQEATRYFGESLLPFIPNLAKTDFSRKASDLNVPASFNTAIIAHQGNIMPEYKYLLEFIKSETQE